MVKTKKKQEAERKDTDLQEQAIHTYIKQQLFKTIGNPPRAARVTMSMIPGFRACRVNVWQKVPNKEKTLLHPMVDKLTNSYWLTIDKIGTIVSSNPELKKVFTQQVVRKVEDTD